MPESIDWRRTPRVLIVEDEPLIAMDLADQVSALGVSVQIAARVEEGWRLFNSWRPHLVVLDVQLPDGDGVALAARILALGPVPLIFVTANNEDHETRARIATLEHAQVYAKGISPRVLQAAIVLGLGEFG